MAHNRFPFDLPKKGKHVQNYSVVSIAKPESAYAEAFRQLQLNIQYAAIDNPYKVIQIASANAGEGKTMTAANLAAIYAEKKSKVVIVDFDFRSPKVHRAFHLHNDVGVADVILGEAKLEEVVHHDASGVDVIVRGKKIPYSNVVIESRACAEFIAELRKLYDVIILDCPPVLLFTDAVLISKYSDATLFVVRYKESKREEAKDAIKVLKNADANVIGVNFMDVDRKSSSYHKYDYYHYYGHKDEKGETTDGTK